MRMIELLKHTLIIFLCAMTLTACSSKTEREAGRGAQAKATPAPDGAIHLTPEQAQANAISTVSVSEQELALAITAVGRATARAGGEAQVFAPFAGRLAVADPAKVPRAGSFVRKGQVIAEVEQLLNASEKVQFATQAAQLQTEIVQAQQEVGLRQTELERVRRLYEGGAMALKQVQTAEFNLQQAQAKYDGTKRAKAQLDAIISQQNAAPRRVPIPAPISGTVIAADLTAGQQTDPSKSLLTIVDLSTVWVEVAVHESNLAAVRRAQSVSFTTPANPERTYTGRLVTVGSVVDAANRTLNVIFSVANADGSLKIGMTAEARIPSGPSARVLLVPASAVLYEEGQPFVFVETEARVYRRRAVTTSERSGENIVVTSGLNVSEKVVTTGAGSLRSETLKGSIPTEEGEKKEKDEREEKR